LKSRGAKAGSVSKNETGYARGTMTKMLVFISAFWKLSAKRKVELLVACHSVVGQLEWNEILFES
jgi:hypothetical protein